MVEISNQTDSDMPDIEKLLDRVFGADRRQKTAYRLRDGVEAIAELQFVVRESGSLLGSLRFWPVDVGSAETGGVNRALLLGPLAVDPGRRQEGIGTGLMRHGLGVAKQLGYKLVILIGDEDYYSQVGFSREAASDMTFPEPCEKVRFLAISIADGGAEIASGPVTPAAG